MIKIYMRYSLLLLLFLSFSSYAQKKKMPKGWSELTINGKTVYLNLSTGKTYKTLPSSKKGEVNLENLYTDDNEAFDPTIIHEVEQGETIADIAVRYNIKIGDLFELNGFDSSVELSVGQEVILGHVHSAEEKKAFFNGDMEVVHQFHDEAISNSGGETYHTVGVKETLFGIAIKYKTTVKEIKRLNNLTSSDISKGQKLRVR